MLRKILEHTLGLLTDAEFAEVLDLVTVDIKVNRYGYSERTSLREVVRVAEICLGVMRRREVAREERMRNLLVKIKPSILQLFCKHTYKRFKRPIDKKTNPYGFAALNDDGILVCTKCGKRL